MTGTLTIVSATRMNESEFWRHSYLGRSLACWPKELRPSLAITFENVGPGARGLPVVYNRAIEEAPDDATLVFVHDDVFLHDVFFREHVRLGLERFDILGLAGSWGTPPSDPAWAFGFNPNEVTPTGWITTTPDRYMTGAVSHSHAVSGTPLVALSVYGPSALPADKLDGLLLIAEVRRLRLAQVRFDERFPWHLYDLDLCQRARRQGLRLGTWPILATHASGGAFGTPDWQRAARLYREIWRDTGPPEKAST